jgi:hypothetical protein
MFKTDFISISVLNKKKGVSQFPQQTLQEFSETRSSLFYHVTQRNMPEDRRPRLRPAGSQKFRVF